MAIAYYTFQISLTCDTAGKMDMIRSTSSPRKRRWNYQGHPSEMRSPGLLVIAIAAIVIGGAMARPLLNEYNAKTGCGRLYAVVDNICLQPNDEEENRFSDVSCSGVTRGDWTVLTIC